MKFLLSTLVFLFYSACIKSQQINYAHLGARITLKCNPQSNFPFHPTNYEWYDHRNIHRGSNMNLVIERFSYDDAGVYTCKASQLVNGQMRTIDQSLTVRVKEQIIRQPIEIKIPSEYRTFASGIVFLTCAVPDGSGSNYKFEWINPRGEITQGANYFQNQVGIADAGRYICRVMRLSDKEVSESVTIVTIQQLPLKVEKVSGELIIGQTVRLNCLVDLSRTDKKVYAQHSYVWEDPQGRVIGTNPILDLKLTETTPMGTYQCKVEARSMKPPYYQNIGIELTMSKNIRDGGRSTGGSFRTYIGRFKTFPDIVRYYEPLNLECEIEPALPGARYEILFNGQRLTSSKFYRIDKLSTSNFGVYTCNIVGIEPSTGSEVRLNVQYSITPEYQSNSKIELARPPGPQLVVRAGDKRELHCEIPANLGSHGTEAVWYFNGREVGNNPDRRFGMDVINRMSVSILVLKNIQSINEGKYECRVRGEMKEAYILVMAGTKHIEINPTEEIRRGDTRYRAIEFHCRIDGYPSKNRHIVWTFMSEETGQITALDSRWVRSDDTTADETSFIIMQNPEVRDSGTYICTEPISGDSARATLKVIDDVTINVSPRIMKLRAGQDARFQCSIRNIGRTVEYPDFFMENGGRAADSQRITVERLEPGKVQLTYRAVTTHDNGTTFKCRQGRSSANVHLFVDPICSTGFRLCRNSQCINSAKFCDGRRDCNDGSDEDQMFCRQCDPLTKNCEYHNGQQATNKFFQIHWACDGEDDCGNGFDESKCFGNVLDCGGLTYRCNDGAKSIPKSYVCDKDRDCSNGDDETNCGAPIIMPEHNSSYIINSRRGETVILTCQANGFPLPRILWRFNWGCLTDERRMIVSEHNRNCLTTTSTLTISNFQPGDDGIYNCEALSGSQRAWSRDYQLLMNFRN